MVIKKAKFTWMPALCVLALAVFSSLVPSPLLAKGQLYCDPAIKSDLMNQQQQRWSQHEQKIDSYWQDPNSFGDMYCGNDLNSAFDSLVSGMGLGSLMGSINSLINSQINKICQNTLALEPLNAADAVDRMCKSAENSAKQSVTDMMSYYLKIIAKYDQAFLDSIYSNKNYSYCLLTKMVMQWVAAHPQYFVK